MNFIIPDSVIISFIQHLEIKNRFVWSALHSREFLNLHARLTQFRKDWECRCCCRHSRNRGRLITPASDPSSRFYHLKRNLIMRGELCVCECRRHIRRFLRDCLGHTYLNLMYHQHRDLNFIRFWRPYQEVPSLLWITRQYLYFKNLSDPLIEPIMDDIDAKMDRIDGFLEHAFVSQQVNHQSPS
jgi:hypothetical protein